MNSIVFLVAFLVLTLIGGFVLWLRERGPRSMEAHMKEFERELQALSPEAPIDPDAPRRRPPPPSPPARSPRSGRHDERGRYR